MVLGPVINPNAVVSSTDSVNSNEDTDRMVIRPLGSGQEVGRSCHILEFKDKRIMLDCGIHPGLKGMDALPFVDMIEADQIDLLLVSHFHLDHAGALPWFLQKTTFKGKCFMTHATKAIYRWLLSDYIKVSNISTDQMLYSEHDLESSMEKIETINFHEEKEVCGIRFWAYHAGHVLGAAMFMIEIAGVRVLYTGDFSREEDRHLMSAELPSLKPHVLIVESTYGTHFHEKRERREARFTNTVLDIVSRGGRCLIPVFALGRAQELLLILDEFWASHPELHEIPIYYASSLAKKCMAVYQTFVNAMNERIKRQIAVSNPFVFKHVSNLKGIDHFDDIGPCVILASPGMMQSGLSRELFEMWCHDSKNGCIVAGYCVEGTLAKLILSEPEEITATNGQRLSLKMQVDYISFSAHTDYRQTSSFIRELMPPHVILVHGEANEMGRLKAALVREYEADTQPNPAGGPVRPAITFHSPRNTQAVELFFNGEKMVKVMGALAVEPPFEGHKVSGILIKRNFNYHMLSSEDLPRYTSMTMSTVTQRQSVHYQGSFELIKFLISQISTDIDCTGSDYSSGKKKLRAFGAIDVLHEKSIITLEWIASPINDMYADCILSCILQADSIEGSRSSLPSLRPHTSSGEGLIHFKECLIETLQEMFGEDSVEKTFSGLVFTVTVDGKEAKVDLGALDVSCEDETLRDIIRTALINLHQSLNPISVVKSPLKVEIKEEPLEL